MSLDDLFEWLWALFVVVGGIVAWCIIVYILMHGP